MQSSTKRSARKGQTGPAITLTHVAREAGVSEITVSRVVRSNGHVSEETRVRVEAAIRKVGYVPNRLAGSLASAGSELIGVILPSLSNIVFPDVLNGIHSVFSPQGYRPLVSVTEYNLEAEYQSLAALLSWRPAALIMTGLEHLAETRHLMQTCGVPVVEVMDIDGEPVDIAVGFSNEGAGGASAKFLLQSGYRRIGYVGHDIERDLRAKKRLAGFEAALRQEGVNCVGQVTMSEPSSVPAGRNGLAQLLQMQPHLDAVYFSNDDMAIGGVFHCMAEGIAIPQQLAIIGYNGLDIGQALPQPLTTVLTRRREIGAVSAQAVLDRLAGHTVPRKTDIACEFITGTTA